MHEYILYIFAKICDFSYTSITHIKEREESAEELYKLEKRAESAEELYKLLPS